MFKNIKKLIGNKKGLGISEVITASTIFIIIYGSILGAININDKTFSVKVKEANMSSTFSEIYGYLYTYKKNYGTSMFKNTIMGSQTCNNTINLTDTNPGTWCVYYPTYNSDDLLFISGALSSSAVSNGSQRYFTALSNDGKVYNSLNKLNLNKQVQVFIRQDTADEDLFFTRIRILDTTNRLLTPSVLYTNFDQSVQLY